MIGKYVALKGDTGKYLARCTNCWVGGRYPDSAFISSTTPTGNALWIPEATTVKNKFRFRSPDTLKYLALCAIDCVPGITRDFAFVNGDTYSPNLVEFVVNYIFPTSGQINLLSDVGTYLARCNGCGPSSRADSASLHVSDPNASWAIWTVVDVGNGKVAFRADNGKYLGRCTNCWIGGFPPDSAFVDFPLSDPAAWWTPIYLNNGKWAFKSDLGRHLAVCTWCVAGVVPNFAFAHVDSPSEGPWAHWTLKVR